MWVCDVNAKLVAFRRVAFRLVVPRLWLIPILIEKISNWHTWLAIYHNKDSFQFYFLYYLIVITSQAFPFRALHTASSLIRIALIVSIATGTDCKLTFGYCSLRLGLVLTHLSLTSVAWANVPTNVLYFHINIHIIFYLWLILYYFQIYFYRSVWRSTRFHYVYAHVTR